MQNRVDNISKLSKSLKAQSTCRDGDQFEQRHPTAGFCCGGKAYHARSGTACCGDKVRVCIELC